MCSSRAVSIRSISDSVVVSIQRQTAKVGGSNPDRAFFRPGFAIENIPALKWDRASGGSHS
eukprot:2293301-Prymnesium_polylepis.1